MDRKDYHFENLKRVPPDENCSNEHEKLLKSKQSQKYSREDVNFSYSEDYKLKDWYWSELFSCKRSNSLLVQA
jgi:hypothetical protein